MYNFYICKLCKIQIYVECDRFFFTPLPDFVMIKMLRPDFETHPNIFIPMQYIRKQGEAKRIRPAESEAAGRAKETRMTKAGTSKTMLPPCFLEM